MKPRGKTPKAPEAPVPFPAEWRRVTLASISDAVITTDTAGCVTFQNPVAESLTGWTAAEAAGQPLDRVFRIINEENRTAVESPMVRALRDGVVIGLANHTLLIAKDGTERPIDDSAAPIRNELGEVAGVVLVFRDITERKHAEKALAISEIRYRRLFEAAKDGILILDARSGKITDANPFMSDLLGYSRDEFSGKELWEIGLFSDKSESQAAVRGLQETGYLRYEHLPLESDRGRKAEVEIVANVYQEDHAPVIQCNIRDITERRRLEQKLAEQTEVLADLHRRKDEFLAMLSHELRNPLAPILNAVQLLGMQKHEDKLQRQARAVIERQVIQLTHLVDDLMDVARIATGRIQLRRERCVINGIVEHAIETARSLVEQRRHDLTVTLSPEPIWLYADAARLEQVVVNLLTNAAKYTPEGGHISLMIEQENQECVLRVRDTGVGIAPKLLPRIFDLFTQAERSLARSQGGLGIGLAVVQRLTELHGGKVEAYSALNHGSEFVVRLPVATMETPPPLSSTDTETAQPTTLSLRVLVVDDNVDATEMLAAMLNDAGHQVRVAHTGPDGLQAAQDFRPQVVLLDIGLPELDGYEVAQRIRKQPALKDVILVAVTGYGQEADMQTSLKAGFNYHLVKPTSFRNVKEILAIAAERAK